MKKIVLINPPYPYGKKQVYMGGALVSVGAQLIEAGCTVDLVDLNILSLEGVTTSLQGADAVGITVIGSPYIPGTIELAQKLAHLKVPVLVGGQVIAKLGHQEFLALFRGTKAVQINSNVDLARALELPLDIIPDAFQTSLIPAWESMPKSMLHAYLCNEMALVFSQGCHFQCAFCAAEKKQKERFKSVDLLHTDLVYLTEVAKKLGLKKLEFYSTSLDFFQNPEELAERLQMISEIQETSGIHIRIRCLACMTSFMKAREVIPNFANLLKDAGLWCVGFGVDGIDEVAWKSQKKVQNKTLEQVWNCLRATEECGITAETLLVMGFPEEGIDQFLKYLIFAQQAIRTHENIMLRPYLAKPHIPGNDYWGKDDPQKIYIRESHRFTNLDFCAVGSPDTHPRRWHRYFANTAYLLICLLGFIGKCCTSPLMPKGKNRVWNAFATWWNRIVPFDR